MNEELIGGLKNALERGESIERAVSSMVAAGYKPSEVREAADELSQGSLSIARAERVNPFLEHPPVALEKQPRPLPTMAAITTMSAGAPPGEKPRDKGKIILIIAIALAIIAVLGLIALLIFTNLFSNLFG